MHVFAAPEWHFWIAVVLTPAAILAVIAVIVLVLNHRYRQLKARQTADFTLLPIG